MTRFLVRCTGSIALLFLLALVAPPVSAQGSTARAPAERATASPPGQDATPPAPRSALAERSPSVPAVAVAGPFARFPDLSPDGRTVAFSWQGDIWTVPVEGGTARRLTVHEAYESQPRWSPDGSELLFMSDRYGSSDLYVIGADGSNPRRLTYHTAPDGPGDWTPDDRILFQTDRAWQQVEREDEIHTVSARGGTPDRLLDAVGYTPTMSPDGRFIAFSYGSNSHTRKRYRGPANKDLWLYDTADGSYTQLTDFPGNDQLPRWSDARTLYFTSERDGSYDLWRLSIADDGGAGSATRLTELGEDGIRHFDISADGRLAVIERGTALWVLELPAGGGAVGEPLAGRAADGAGPSRLELEVPEDVRFPAVERRTFTDDADEYAVSPDGEYVAFGVRGELFLTKNDDEASRTVRLTRHPWRDRDVAWLSDEALIFASDRDGDYDLYRLESADPDQPDLFLTLKHRVVRLTDTDVEEREPVVSNDGERVAFLQGRGDLVIAEVADGALGRERVLVDGWAGPEGVSWSPDDRYLAYALPDLDFNSEVFIHPLEGGEPVNVTQHPKGDGAPVWSRDGSKLAFLSQRNNGDSDVWFVWLREADWEKTRLDWELEEELAGEEREEADSVVAPVEIDFEGIHERLMQVTSLPGNESDLAISHDGEWLYFVANRSGRQSFDAAQDLYKVKWDGTEMDGLTSGGQAPYGVSLGPKGQHLFLMRRGRLARVKPDGGSVEGIPFSARMDIRFADEAAQVFSEAWRVLNDGFYDPDFHGQDWRALREKYEPWAMAASTRSDFRDVFNWMLGELNASHLGLYGPDRAETERERTGLLGVELEPVPGGVRVERVIPKSPADREFSRLYAGDVITAVDGDPVRPDRSFYALLTDRVNDRVVLSVRGDDGEREVVIRPTGSLGRELYDEWVEDRRALTERYSDGRLGYIHIQGMNWPSFERFERELVAAGAGKDGLVIDVRYNGGGWTTDYLMAVLTVRQHAYTVPRGATEDLENTHSRFAAHYPFGERLPLAAWTGPSVALCNANSFSNAEIFSHAYKNLGLGTLVGTPTYGAVISTGGAGLIDGSFVRLPFRGWYVKATGQNMENGPAVPDIIVPEPPNDRENGEDEQLRRAVEVLLGEIR
jgi:tricorn protease